MKKKQFLTIILLLSFFCKAYGQDLSDEEQLLNKANEYSENNHFQEALHIYHKLYIRLYDNYQNKTNGAQLLWKVLSELGNTYSALDKLDSMEIYYNEADLFIKNEFKDSVVIIAQMNALFGDLYFRKSDFNVSLHFYSKALDLYQSIHFIRKIEIATLYQNLAKVYNELDQMNKAYKLQKDAIELAESLLGNSHSELAMFYGKMGQFLYKKANYKEAYHYFLQQKNSAELSNDSLDIANAWQEFAIINWKMENYEVASFYYNKTLTIYSHKFGYYHSKVSNCYHNIGLLYIDYEHYDIALHFIKKDLEICSTIYEKDNIAISHTLATLGTIFYLKKNYIESLNYFYKALENYKMKFDEEHSDIALVYDGMSEVYYDIEEKEKAIFYAQKAYDIFCITLGKNHPYSKSALENVLFFKKN